MLKEIELRCGVRVSMEGWDNVVRVRARGPGDFFVENDGRDLTFLVWKSSLPKLRKLIDDFMEEDSDGV